MKNVALKEHPTTDLLMAGETLLNEVKELLHSIDGEEFNVLKERIQKSVLLMEKQLNRLSQLDDLGSIQEDIDYIQSNIEHLLGLIDIALSAQLSSNKNSLLKAIHHIKQLS